MPQLEEVGSRGVLCVWDRCASFVPRIVTGQNSVCIEANLSSAVWRAVQSDWVTIHGQVVLLASCMLLLFLFRLLPFSLCPILKISPSFVLIHTTLFHHQEGGQVLPSKKEISPVSSAYNSPSLGASEAVLAPPSELLQGSGGRPTRKIFWAVSNQFANQYTNWFAYWFGGPRTSTRTSPD